METDDKNTENSALLKAIELYIAEMNEVEKSAQKELSEIQKEVAVILEKYDDSFLISDS